MFKLSAVLLAATALFVPSALAGEGVHLANCGPNIGSTYASVMAYYPDDSNANGPPLTQNIASADPQSQQVTWEGHSFTGHFASGNSFTSNINSGSFSPGQYAGSGHNDQRNFACFRDNNRQLWRASDAYACFSIYYCLDA